MRDKLLELFEAAVAAAQPEVCLRGMFPPPPEGRLIVISCGKAGASMAQAAERHYTEMAAAGRFTGLAVTRYGYGLELDSTELIEAGHPVPDEQSVRAAERALTLAQSAGQNDLVLVLLSGGASALCVAPAEGVTLEDKQAVTRALLRSGARIHDINCVRKHISRFKGGRLARSAAPARLITLAISDVPGDEPESIGSGPTVPDPTTLEEARRVIERFGITPPASVAAALRDPANETPKPGDPIFANTEFHIVASARGALVAAAERAAAMGYAPMVLGDALEGEARGLAAEHARLAMTAQKAGGKVALLSGGEATVTVRGDGRGGPNQEYALALAIALNGAPGIAALAADTDGSDGGTGAANDPAGAVIDANTLRRAAARNLDAATFLANNDSGSFFAALDDLIIRGPTRTNVNDFRAILVDPPEGHVSDGDTAT